MLTVAQATAFLAGPEGKTPSKEVAFLSSGPVVCMVVESDGDAVDELNKLLGPSSPEEARSQDEKRSEENECVADAMPMQMLILKRILQTKRRW